MNQRKITQLMLLVILVISSGICSLPLSFSSEGTIVGGEIRRDTVWTKENSPYILEDDLTIRSGVSLRIQEGVVVDFALWSLIVNGEFKALGNPGEEITFYFPTLPLTGYKYARIVFTEESRPWREDSTRGCMFEYVKMYCSADTNRYGLIKGGTVKLDHVAIYDSEPYSKHYTVDIDGSITNCLFVRDIRPINMGEGTIIDNQFINSSHIVITINDGLVRDNLIDGGKRGISIKNGLVKNNTIRNLSSRGINMVNAPTSENSSELRPIINQNLISYCGEHAVFISGDIRPIITQNVLLENENGIYFYEDAFYEGVRPQISNNVFYNNENNIYFDREDPRIEIKLQNNWWGTDDPEVIEDKIYYESDDPRITAALYEPILSEIPLFLPKIPYEISISNPGIEVGYDEVIPLIGTVDPPLKQFELNIRYDGPDTLGYDKTLWTDSSGVFIDEFSPNMEGLWNISITFEESESYTYELSQQVLVDNTDNTISSEQELPNSDDGPEDNASTDNDPVIEVDTDDGSNSESDSVDESTTGNESSIDNSETEDNEVQTISYTENETQTRDPIILGFIPSILIIILMIAAYLGTQKFR